jgi:hypothetical protein
MDLLIGDTAVVPAGRSADTQFETITAAIMALDEVREGFESHFASWQAGGRISSHRKSHRIPVERPLRITPLDSDSTLAGVDAIQGVSRDISPEGLSFVSPKPLPYRRVIIEFANIQMPRLVAELTWCRFRRDRSHQCGGVFIGLTHC